MRAKIDWIYGCQKKKKRILKSSNRSLFASETSLSLLAISSAAIYGDIMRKNAIKIHLERIDVSHTATAAQHSIARREQFRRQMHSKFEVFPSINFTRVENQPAKTRPRPEEMSSSRKSSPQVNGRK